MGSLLQNPTRSWPLWVGLLVLGASVPPQDPRLGAAEPPPRTSEHGWIEYRAGDAPLILAVPHGGTLKPAALRDRSRGVRLTDRRTAELALEIAEAFQRRTGRRPHLVICHLHRSKLDANRDQGDGAQGDAGALAAWHAWHGFLDQAKERLIEEHGSGLLVDVHGQTHPEGWIEWGYALTRSELARGDTELTVEHLMDRATVQTLATRGGGDLAPILRGPWSLGGLAEAAGYPSVPSPTHPHPGTASYFDGGYNTRRHGSRKGGAVDAVQMEVPRDLRWEPTRRRRFARDVAGCLQEYLERWYGLELRGSGPRVGEPDGSGSRRGSGDGPGRAGGPGDPDSSGGPGAR